jgi:hypothetical protein
MHTTAYGSHLPKKTQSENPCNDLINNFDSFLIIPIYLGPRIKSTHPSVNFLQSNLSSRHLDFLSTP